MVRDPGHGVGRRQLLGPLVSRSILDRDHRLVCQRLQHPDFAPFQRPWFLHVNGQHTDDLPSQAHRHSDSPLQADSPRQRQGRAALINEVELQHLLGPHHAWGGHVAALADRGQLASRRGTHDHI